MTVNEENGKPKFQLSWQTQVLQGGIAVVTGNTFSDFKENMNSMTGYLSSWKRLQTVNEISVPATQVTTTPVQAPVTPVAATNVLGNCTKCGAPNLVSRAGNKYCSERCWIK